ncbi:hypothetical protein PG993_006271 [Apiospora rasikravindrae]|uniref:Transcription factor Iwr1 domain-containing protein n=1 Tax=Apiospora rasikravindrae TaxID=990691 RepID=A0ABR1T7P8_9PEZI
MYSASRKRQIKRVERRLFAAAQIPQETCPMKAQAKAYKEARELTWELDEDPEASFFGSCCGEADDSPAVVAAHTNRTHTGEEEGHTSLFSSVDSVSSANKRKKDIHHDTNAAITTKKPKSAVVAVSFAPGHATNLETGEDVPANQSGLSWRDWETMNRSRNARAQLDAMRAAAEGRPVEKDSDESESDSDYENSTDESDGEWEEEIDLDVDMEMGVLFEKDDDDDNDDEAVYDERLSSSGTPNDDSDLEWNSDDSDPDSSEYDSDYDSDEEEEEDGPEWEFY